MTAFGHISEVPLAASEDRLRCVGHGATGHCL